MASGRQTIETLRRDVWWIALQSFWHAGHGQPRIVLLSSNIHRTPHLSLDFETFNLWRTVLLLDDQSNAASRRLEAALTRMRDALCSISEANEEIEDLDNIKRPHGTAPEVDPLRAKAEEKKYQHELALRLAEEDISNLTQRSRDTKSQREQLAKDALVPLQRALNEIGVLPDAQNDRPPRVQVLEKVKRSGPPPLAEVLSNSSLCCGRLKTHIQSEPWPKNAWNGDDAQPLDWIPKTKDHASATQSHARLSREHMEQRRWRGTTVRRLATTSAEIRARSSTCHLLRHGEGV
jgi:hypothetical protein